MPIYQIPHCPFPTKSCGWGQGFEECEGKQVKERGKKNLLQKLDLFKVVKSGYVYCIVILMYRIAYRIVKYIDQYIVSNEAQNNI